MEAHVFKIGTFAEGYQTVKFLGENIAEFEDHSTKQEFTLIKLINDKFALIITDYETKGYVRKWHYTTKDELFREHLKLFNIAVENDKLEDMVKSVGEKLKNNT